MSALKRWTAALLLLVLAGCGVDETTTAGLNWEVQVSR